MDHLDLDRQFQILGSQDDGYYHQYCRLYLANVVLTAQVKDLIDEKNKLLSKIQKFSDQGCCSSQDKNNEKSKRLRRTAHQIYRYYQCCIKTCEKSYGSEGSLNQHYKLKHPQIYASLANVQVHLKYKDQEESISQRSSQKLKQFQRNNK